MTRVTCITENGVTLDFDFIAVPRVGDVVRNTLGQAGNVDRVVTSVIWCLPGGTPTIHMEKVRP